MLIELSNGQKVDTDSTAFSKLPEEMQQKLIEQQEKLIKKRAAKNLASQKCRALQQGKPWPPLPATEQPDTAVGQ